MTSENKREQHDDTPILHPFPGPFDEEHLQAFLAEHINFNDIATTAITPPGKRDPNKRRPEILAIVGGTSQEQNVEETYSVYTEYELRELVKESLSGNTLSPQAARAILQKITSQTLQTLDQNAEKHVAGHPVNVVVRFAKPAGPRVGNPLVPLPVPPLGRDSLN